MGLGQFVGLGLAEQLVQLGQGHGHGLGPVGQPVPEDDGDVGIVGRSLHDAVRHSLQKRVGPLRCLVDTVALQNPRTEPGGSGGQLLQEPGLAAARLGVDGHQATSSPPSLVEVGGQDGQFGLAADERGFGQHAATVVETDDHHGLGHAVRQGYRDGLDVGEGAPRRLVALAWFLAQKSVYHGLQSSARGAAVLVTLRAGTGRLRC